MQTQWIDIKNAHQNNLKNISLKIPRNHFIVIAGVSGSGKSSLAFDIINKEGQRQFFVNLSAQARKYLGKLEKPKVESIKGLTPTISIAQTSTNNNPRSTVGTLTDIYDSLRLLFARLGQSHSSNLTINKSLFSFNSLSGACSNCQGLGVEDVISVDLLIKDESLSIREGCFKITNPDGYIIYSQVRMEELEKVCVANGFSVDIPWKNLTKEQQDIVLNGSDKIKILYGKHSLESRMKWTGIKANPREEEFYKGILPVMNQILHKDRNPNILRFAKTKVCTHCEGNRLRNEALQVKILGKSISEFSHLSLLNLNSEIELFNFPPKQQKIAKPIVENIQKNIDNLLKLGLGHLSLNRSANTLSAVEIQSIKLAAQLNSTLQNITYVFDETSVGLHPTKNKNRIKILKQLVAQGNTVIVVEHDAETIKNADWIVEIGPKAGIKGGRLLFNGSAKEFFDKRYLSNTKDYLLGKKTIHFNPKKVSSSFFEIKGACINNLKSIDVKFKTKSLNILTGVAGAGKSSLIHQTLIPLIHNSYYQQINSKGNPKLSNFNFDKVIVLEQAPIGKTARSIPATYTKLFDLIRDFFARLPEAKTRKFNKSAFSFNTKGGRCEHCEGSGKLEVGMHFLGNVESTCPTCKGSRFKDEILELNYQGKNISDVLNMTVEEALIYFSGQAKIEKYLLVLDKIGLGYLQLGQSSNTLSGGEAQRIRLAAELVKESTSNQLFIFDKPSSGLHFSDIQRLLYIFEELINKGHTVLLIEHNPDLIRIADYIIDLGPESGDKGGDLVFSGTYKELLNCKKSITGQALQLLLKDNEKESYFATQNQTIALKGLTTHNLKNIDVTIPHHQHTVIIGKSGSGKSSLAFDTIYTEAQNRFIESFPNYVQQFVRQQSQSEWNFIKGLTPSIALKQTNKIKNHRSTIGTLTGLSEHLRLLMARFGTSYCPICQKEIDHHFCTHCKQEFVDTKQAMNYSFNNADGVCTNCKGLGEVLNSSPNLLIEHPELSLIEGALVKHKLLNSYTNPHEKYMATLLEVGKQRQIDFHRAVGDLSSEALQIAFFGTGDTEYNVEWLFKTKTKTGKHQFKGKWQGFVGLLLEEYYRKQANGKGSDLLPFLNYETCPSCQGKRFKPEILNVRFYQKNIDQLSNLKITDLLSFFQALPKSNLTEQIIDNIIEQLQYLEQFNLGYLHLDRKSNTLSGGELQRVLLSSQLKGSLTGLTYILDEPSSGLHPNDIKLLSENINKLVEKGNTVITVEHQIELIKTADYIIELGPDAGDYGGELMFSGNASDYQFNDKEQVKLEWSLSDKPTFIRIVGAQIYNLKNIEVSFIKNAFNVIVGVSGSGKTILMQEVLLKSKRQAVHCRVVEGLNDISEMIWLDRNSMTATSSSSLVTYLDIIGDIKKIFTPSLQNTSIKAAQLSYNHKSGQCPECKGLGFVKVKMDFLTDVNTLCETCNGKRYKEEVLFVKWKHKNIAEILEMTVGEALRFFEKETQLTKKLELLTRLGLSYLKLGQSSLTFSGGELQRLKIAHELLNQKASSQLYVFDEASRGLHQTDLKYLLQTFKLLLEKGHTIIAIEHQPDIIRNAQHLVEIHNGELVYQGKVEGLKTVQKSLTAKYI